MRILLIDDEPVLRESIGILLKRMDPTLSIQEASDGEVALEAMIQEPFDAIFTDIRMPRMDGIALIQMVNERWPDVQIVILTGYASFDYARKALQCGAADYLLKPIRYADLCSVLEKVIKRYKEAVSERSRHPAFDAKSMQAIMKDACDYVYQHYNENLSLSRMSHAFHLNASYFCEQFSKIVGISFIEYLTDVRMENARKLLNHYPERSVTDIALEVGYSDARYFSQVFRKRYGITPSEFRKPAAGPLGQA